MSSKSVMIIAHPGHELLLHRWMERERPMVLIWTDGSGSHGARPRLEESRRLITAAGATAGSVFGVAGDRRFYSAILTQDVALFSHLLDLTTQALIDNLTNQIVSDPIEECEPIHDLCSVISALAAQRAASTLKHAIRHLDYDIEFRGPHKRAQAPQEVIMLDAPQLERKQQAVASVPALGIEIDRMRRLDPGLMQSEVLYERPYRGDLLPAPRAVPHYETAGAVLVASGAFKTLITYREHVAPLVRHLAVAPGRGNAV